MFRNGFMMLEALISCVLVTLTWYVITQCAAQALMIERTINRKADALIAATTVVEKLRAGPYSLKNQTITQGAVTVIVACGQHVYNNSLCVVTVTALVDSHEVVCLKTAVRVLRD